MLDLDKWQEIFATIRANKLRTVLTAFSVAWGIFMLIVLVGSGEGLANGFEYQFRDDATNSLWVYRGQTSLAHAGFLPGRRIQFTNQDHEDVETGIPGVEHVTSRFYLNGNATITHGKETGSFDVRSVHPDHVYLERTIMTEGRFINELDIRDHRKTAAIGVRVRDALFGSRPAVGEEITVNGIAFKVVGLFEDAGGEGEMEKVYLPISTAQRAFGGANRVHQFMLTTGDAKLEETRAIASSIRRKLALRHDFSPADERAVRVNNNFENYQRFASVLDGIRAFVWLIGAGTILAGVVGVSNIMMIVVRERTREIGVRKALGATPWSVVSLVLQESVLITAVAGYSGLVLGVATLELGARLLPDSDFFRDPSIDLNVAIQATVLLVVAGAFAGLIPARRAAAIRPIEALREE